MARLPAPAARERWSRLIQLQKQPDLTIADFCDLHGVSTASFYQWRRKIQEQTNQAAEFLAVQVGHAHASAAGVIVRFACGARIELDRGDQSSLQVIVSQLANAGNEAAQ